MPIPAQVFLALLYVLTRHMQFAIFTASLLFHNEDFFGCAGDANAAYMPMKITLAAK
jgi:hypothetical protein